MAPTEVTPATDVATQPLPASPASSAESAVVCPSVVSPLIQPTPSPSVSKELPPKSEPLSDPSPVVAPISIEHLLPPRFNVADPSQIRVNDQDDFKVLLPDGSGGTTQFDQRVLHVQHEGEKVSLVALTPQQRLRRRFVSNAIAILVGIAILALAFWLLS